MIVASPLPQIAVTRRKTHGATVGGFSTGIGWMTGPLFCGGWPLATGVLPPAAAGGAGVPGCDRGPGFETGPGFAAGAGGGGGASTYFRAKSETMSCLSETFAFN